MSGAVFFTLIGAFSLGIAAGLASHSLAVATFVAIGVLAIVMALGLGLPGSSK